MKSRFLNFKQPRTPRQNNSPASYYSTPPVNNKTTSSHFKESARTERSKQEKSKEKQEILLQDRLLDAALRRVSDYGWSDDCVAAGARDLGISSGAAGIFDDGAGELVGRYIERCNERMASKLQDSIWVKENGLDGAGVMKKILTAVKMRIEMIEPYHASWGQAMALQTLPANVPLAAQRTAKMVDEIWHFAGDKATDVSANAVIVAKFYCSDQSVFTIPKRLTNVQ